MTQEPLPEEAPETQTGTEAPPPIEPPPVPESLAEQVWRESHTVPESTGPSDIVPNRPNIRPPGVVEEPVVEEEETETEPVPVEHRTAADLIAEADAAQTTEELDEIEAQAEGRVTVLNAVAERRAAIA